MRRRRNVLALLEENGNALVSVLSGPRRQSELSPGNRGPKCDASVSWRSRDVAIANWLVACAAAAFCKATTKSPDDAAPITAADNQKNANSFGTTVFGLGRPSRSHHCPI
jgi:hypothetical protein